MWVWVWVWVWEYLIPIGLGRTFIVACDDNTVGPRMFLSEDQKTETIGKISLVLKIVSEIVSILGKNCAGGKFDWVTFFIKRNFNLRAGGSSQKICMITGIIPKI